jgi:hypothetical protein
MYFEEAWRTPKETNMPVKVSYPGYSSEAEYRAALAEELAAKTAYEAANDTRFDAAVRRLAPVDAEAGRPAKRYGTAWSNGKPITPSTMRRILERLPELHLGEGPSDRKRAASDRRMPYRYRPGRQSGVTGLKNTLADIAKAES